MFAEYLTAKTLKKVSVLNEQTEDSILIATLCPKFNLFSLNTAMFFYLKDCLIEKKIFAKKINLIEDLKGSFCELIEPSKKALARQKMQFSYFTQNAILSRQYIFYALLPIINLKKKTIGLLLKMLILNHFDTDFTEIQKKLLPCTQQTKKTMGYEGISVQQGQCLYYFLNRKSIQETANILNLSPGTVKRYLEDIKFKLKCENRAGLFKEAIDRGIYQLKRLVMMNLKIM